MLHMCLCMYAYTYIQVELLDFGEGRYFTGSISIEIRRWAARFLPLIFKVQILWTAHS